MAPRSILSRKDVERLHPGVPLEGFVPTHLVELVDARTQKVLSKDAVALGPEEGPVRFGFVPGDGRPHYAVISSGKWQSLVRHGVVREQPIRYVPDYVPLTERDGFVYFVERGCGGPIKIGWSQDVDRRLAELQTANAEILRVLGKVPGRMRDESKMHERFAYLRLEAEWFRNAREIHEFLASVGVEE
jgi:hypothetical protein